MKQTKSDEEENIKAKEKESRNGGKVLK